MAQIASIGLYIPRLRIEASEINAAWGRPTGKGRKSAAALDEDALTLGIAAAKDCLSCSEAATSAIGLLAFASISSGYSEYSLAALAAQALNLATSANVADFGLSARSGAAALLSAADAVDSKRFPSALVIASDKLISQPGSSFELNFGSGAGALVLSQKGFAEIEAVASHTTGFIGFSRAEGQFHGLVDERFVMQHGYLEPAQEAVTRLRELTKSGEWNHLALQAPDERWSARLTKNLKLPPERLRSAGAQIGYAGCGSFLINLALAFEAAKPGERILALSYGSGGCDALSIKVAAKPKMGNPPKEAVAGGELIKYPQYLRMNKLLRGEP